MCVIGCGTALTIDLIEYGHHLGGYIFPSIYLQRESLFSGTRQISIIEGTFDSIASGTNTQDAVHRGILLSIVGAINETIRHYSDFNITITGGILPRLVLHDGTCTDSARFATGRVTTFFYKLTLIH